MTHDRRDAHNITASRSTDWLFEVSRGRISGHDVKRIDSFLPVVDIDDGTVDVWTGGGDLVYLTAAETMNVASDSANDVQFGSGGRICVLIGVDNDYKEISEAVIMNGPTPVETTKKFLRVNDCVAIESGISEVNEGNITSTASGSGTLQCHCASGYTRSQNSQFTVPLGKSFIAIGWSPQGARTIPGGQTPCFLVDVDGRVRIPATNLSISRQFTYRLDTGLGQLGYEPFPVENPIIERSDVRIRCSTDTNGSEFRATLYGIQYSSDIA